MTPRTTLLWVLTGLFAVRVAAQSAARLIDAPLMGTGAGGRKAMSRADAIRGMCQNLMGERSEEGVLRAATIIRAERLNVESIAPLDGRDPNHA